MQDTETSRPSPLTASDAVELLDALAAQPGIVRMNQAARQIDALRAVLGRVPLRLACLASFTFDPLKAAMELQGVRAGFALETYVSPYGRFEQELIDPQSELSAFAPQAILLAVRLADTCAAIYDEFNSLPPEECDRLVNEWFARLRAALDSYRQRSKSPILIQNYESVVAPALGIADMAASHSQSAVIRAANQRLLTLAKEIGNAYVLDYDGLVARIGRESWSDARTRLFARIPVASQHYWRLAGFYVQHLRPLYGLSKKVLALDADHTLWGGVVGDVGTHGIALGKDFPGNAYVAFQKKVLDLHQRGVVLVIASKNEPGAVEQVLDQHPDMVLRRKHFASLRVNWNAKPQNLREIADELNLGIDSFVFIDDSPVECDLMRKSLHEVLTIQLPKDPAGYPAVIDALDCFEQWTISDEDRQRGELYRAESERKQLQSVAMDMPTFYRQLEMKMTLHINHPPHVARAAQMTNRTNQFNMHTTRCTEDDIRAFMADGSHEIVTVALADRFGDNGIIGMALVRRDAAEWTIRQFLMSCRVLGRTVEQSLLQWIADRAKKSGIKRLLAEFVPTPKNKPFAVFFRSCGLTLAGKRDDKVELWELALESRQVEPIPDWIQLTAHEG
ncbi:MAG: HAD family hydrolase [Phycisphaerae bacterium]|nr:HAD family hydrolase [Phycisphaerae bacterium]